MIRKIEYFYRENDAQKKQLVRCQGKSYLYITDSVMCIMEIQYKRKHYPGQA